jgi:cobalt-zinc-cadmium efflux system outer membrane protein
LQASLLPNPEIEMEVEEVGGTGERSGFDGAETTIQLGQLIELAGKRSKRKRVASLESKLAGWDYEAKRLDVLTGVAHAFVKVLAAKERLTLAEELVRLSEQILNTVTQRVEAGKDSPVEKTKAQVALASARIEQKQAHQRLVSARKQLAATWGSISPVFEGVTGQLDVTFPIPSETELRRLLEQNPDLARWAIEMERRRAALELEKANAITDPTIFGGMQRFKETDDTAVVFGLSIPIPISNRNQGRILEARYNIAKARRQRRDAEANLYVALADAYEALSSALIEVTALKNEVLPGAQSAFDATRQGYRQGKFDYLMVLDAQRTFFYARARYIESLAAYHGAMADVERLIGQRIDTVKTTHR